MKVAVFEHAGKRPPSMRLSAYTLWYNPDWPGCCLHEVEAKNGTEAKKMAMREHRERCIKAEVSR